jgi:hypothetical protein
MYWTEASVRHRTLGSPASTTVASWPNVAFDLSQSAPLACMDCDVEDADHTSDKKLKAYRLLTSVRVKQAVKRSRPVEPADLVAKAIGSEQVTHAPTGADNPQGYTSCRSFRMQLVQHA